MTPDEAIATANLEEAKASLWEAGRNMVEYAELYQKDPAALAVTELEASLGKLAKAGQEVLKAQAELDKAKGG